MSKLSEVLTDFNFGEKTVSGKVIPETEVQKAFLENLYLAGYFKPEFIWQAINLMQYDKSGNVITTYDKEAAEYRRRWDKAGGVDAVFLGLSKAIIAAKADQDDPEKFKPDVLLENLFKSEIFDRQDVEDVLVYLAQSAFGRNTNQERNELARQAWQALHKERYIENARKMGMIEAATYKDSPSFDEAWIQGAARFRTTTRVQSLRDSSVKYDKARMLTGERELWVEIDKMPAARSETEAGKIAAEAISIAEAKLFMLKLAKENGVKVCGFEERVVAGSKRTYPKYEAGETRKLTETMMAKKVYQDVFGRSLEEDEIIDSAAQGSTLRPDTYKTALDATRGLLVERCKTSEAPVKVLVVSNQPYVDRQVLTNKRAVQESIKKEGIASDAAVDFAGFGEKCEVGVAAVHSEFGALVGEGFMQRSCEKDLPRKCATENLMFSSRCKDLTKVPPILLVTAKPQGERVAAQQSSLAK